MTIENTRNKTKRNWWKNGRMNENYLIKAITRLNLQIIISLIWNFKGFKWNFRKNIYKEESEK